MLNKPKLSYETIGEPEIGFCGHFKWKIRWYLDKAAAADGWVIQRVTIDYKIKTCSGKEIKRFEEWTKFYEAWPIKKGESVTPYEDYDDLYLGMPDWSDKIHGYMDVRGIAVFCEDFTLPDCFKVDKQSPAGRLPMTKTLPRGTLKNFKNKVHHNVKAEWDCCRGGHVTRRPTNVTFSRA